MDFVLSVEQVFSERLLRVPDYQRGYAWGEDQWDELLEDLDLLASGKPHYTGTLVLHTQGGSQVVDEEGKRYTCVDVVDGQQRLTTIVVLIDAIRRELLQLPDRQRLADGLRRHYVSTTSLNKQALYKLTLGSDSHDFFARKVVAEQPAPGGPEIVSHDRLLGARRYFTAYLASRRQDVSDGFDAWLVEFLQKVTHQLKLSVYEVSDEMDVGVVFEVMNNRGKPLVELEKVKNYLLYVASKLDVQAEVLRAEVNLAWAKIFKNLMTTGINKSPDEDQLLRAHWFMAYDYDARKWDGSKSIKQRFDLRKYQGRHAELLGELLAYVRGLCDASLAYCEILNPSLPGAFRGLEGDARQRRMLVKAAERLRHVGVAAVFLPLLIATRLRFPHNADTCREVFELCELFAFRVYVLLGARSNAGRTKLHARGHKLNAGSIDLDEVRHGMLSDIRYYSPSADFDAKFDPDPERPWYNRNGLKYLLYEYETTLAGKDEVRVPWADIEGRSLEDSVEHILPQTPSDPYWQAQFSAQDRAAWTHDIGNLCLTYHNSSYKHFSFPKKKGAPGQETPCYANSNLYMERRLAQYADWNIDTLKTRRAEIVEWAKRRWHVEPAPVGDAAQRGPGDDADDAEADKI